MHFVAVAKSLCYNESNVTDLVLLQKWDYLLQFERHDNL